MKKTLFIVQLLTFMFFTAFPDLAGQDKSSENCKEKTIFVYSGLSKPFVKYVAQLTGKPNPKICFLPTASGDNPNQIITWYELCQGLSVDPYVQRIWINSYRQKETFEEILLKMDAIIAGGGNTLNMLALWKAQGIDTILNKALQKGIILSGGSAGGLCWFVHGTSDSRPKNVSTVEGLGFLNYSHSPHYNSHEWRRPLYHKKILNGDFIPGYACDDNAGMVFINGEFSRSVSLGKDYHAYFVDLKNGQVEELQLESEIIE